MLDLVKKAALAGVGAASLTVEKAEELARELVVKGKMTELEGRKFVAEMKSRAEESKDSLKQYAENAAEQIVGKMNLVQVDEMRALAQEVERLRAEIEEMKRS